VSGKKVRSHFNLLLEPGSNAYLEILNPAKQLTYAVSLNREEILFLWAQDQNYLRESSTPENLNAITGLPVLPDDLLFLVAGQGLNFAEWNMEAERKDGWNLSRSPFLVELTMKEELSRIVITSPGADRWTAGYDRYRLWNNRLVPAQIRFEVPTRRIAIDLEIDKWIPRDEPASQDLFAVKLPDHAQRLSLWDIYHGKPLLLQ